MLLKNIKALCKEHGETLTSLEKVCGFGKGTISRWAKSSPSIESVKKVADTFGVSLDCLISEEDHKTRGSITVYRGEEPVCGCRFYSMRTLLNFIQMFVNGEDLVVEIRKPKAEEMGQAVSYSAKQ